MCETCKQPFELLLTISEREKGDLKCPTCKGTKVVPQLGGFMAFSGGSGREVRAHLGLRRPSGVGPRVEESALMLIDSCPWSALWTRCGSGGVDGFPRRSWRLTRHLGYCVSRP
jgi:hypothetical protein